MSHWMKVQIKIKSLSALERACKKLDIEYREVTSVTSRYAGKLNTVACLSKDGGEIAVIQDGEEYILQVDEWRNPIVGTVGKGCSLLTRGYTEEVVTDRIDEVGMLSDRQVLQDGSVVLTGVFL